MAGEPARGYSRPPFEVGNAVGRQFEPGNQAHLHHGVLAAARTAQVAEPVAALVAETAERYPWTAGFPDELHAYARALLDEQDVRTYLDRVGLLDERGRERPAVRTLDRFVAHAARCRARLGLNPLSHARLLLTVAEVIRAHPERGGLLGDSLEALMAEGREALERGAVRRQVAAAGDGSASPAMAADGDSGLPENGEREL